MKIELPRRWLSVDPGLLGAIVIWEDHWPVAIRDMPTEIKRERKGKRDLRQLDVLELDELLCGMNAHHVAIEEMYIGRAGKASLASLFYQAGAAHTMMKLAGVSYTEISPRKWKPSFGVPGVSVPGHARRTVAICREVIKQYGWGVGSCVRLVKHSNRAEALLIGAYWMETYTTWQEKSS